MNWLLLDEAGAKQLAATAAVGQEVDPKLLVQLAGNGQGYTGQITCFDGQTVHIISGQLKTIIQSLIPVVGQAGEYSTEGLASSAAPHRTVVRTAILEREDESLSGKLRFVQNIQRNVAYQPVVGTLHTGTLLQVTPSLMPDGATAVLDLQSFFTRPNVGASAVAFRDVMELDKFSIDAQQLMTTLQVPLGKPVLAGGLTIATVERSGAAANQKEPPHPGGPWQLYLVVEARVAQRPQNKSRGQ